MASQSRPDKTADALVLSPEDLAEALRGARIAAFLGTAVPSTAPYIQLPPDVRQLIDKTAFVYAAAVSEETRADYVRRWRRFEHWCNAVQLTCLPAESGTVMLFLAEQVTTRPPASLSTIRGLLAAINRIQLEAGHPAPGDDPAMALFLRGLRRSLDPREFAEPVKALRIAELREVCRAIDGVTADPVLVRDRAILTLHSRGIGTSEIARLRWQDVHAGTHRLQLRIRPSRRRGDEHGVRLLNKSRDTLSPAAAMTAWHAVGGAASGNCFVRVDARARVKQDPLHASEIERIIQTRLDSLGDGNRPASPQHAVLLLGQRPSIDVRDRALLLVGFAGAFRRNELANLCWSDVRHTPDGMVIRVRRSKTDLSGHGKDIGIPYGRSELTCPVKALVAWRNQVEAHLTMSVGPEDPCFVQVGRAGRIGRQRITPEAISRVVRRRAEQAGLEGRWGGRSLRAGFISTAADLDIPLELIARQSRHATLDKLILYIRQDDPFRRNAAARLGM